MRRYIITGGVAGGATTAARLRRMDENARIILFERGDYISYANCGLPYYIGNTIKDRENLFVQTPQSFSQRFNIDIRTRQEVISIDPDKKTADVKMLDSDKIITEKYDYLILSPGANPLKPPIPGISSDNIFSVRNVPDIDQLKGFIEKKKPRKAVIVGAGFIGLEMAENLHNLGIMVTIVEMVDQVMTTLDYEMAAEIHQHLKTWDVELYLKDGVSSFKKDDDIITVKLNSGKEITCNMVILSIGVRPETILAKEAGLETGSAGGIKVNEYLQTSNENIYALGDAIEVKNPVIDRDMLIPLAGPANKQGRITADNIVFGNHKSYDGTIGTAVAKVFDLTVGSTGVSEKILRKENIPYISSITHGSSHAGYYPMAKSLTIKIVFSPDDGLLYGAQIIGYEGVDKRTDVFSSFIRLRKTVYDLIEFEHAYAPPYSSAKDPINIAGAVAENILNDRMKIIHWNDILELDPSGVLLVDVRTRDEFELGTIEGAVNIPVDEIRERINEIPRDKKTVLFCEIGMRGYIAARILYQKGYTNLFNLSGGYKTYEHVAQKQSNEDIFEKDFIGKDDLIYRTIPDIAENPSHKDSTVRNIEVDACGLQCPGPILKLKKEIGSLENGDIISITSTDPGFKPDVKAWCNVTGNELIGISSEQGIIRARIKKSDKARDYNSAVSNKSKTLVVFSDDLDRALASFVIANGAASMGSQVTMFFTFWGLNILKKPKKPEIKKDFMGAMFGRMLPGSVRNLKLSKLNMMGIGTLMMKKRMKSKKVDSLDEMIKSAIDSNIKLVACQMTMDIMGIDKKELYDNVVVGGVASYLEEADKSNLNLFI